MNLDLIEVIGNQCDNKTWMNLCCAHHEYYTTQKEMLAQQEASHFIDFMIPLIRKFPHQKNKHSRLKYIHKILRSVLGYTHILYLLPAFVGELRSKLDESFSAGMSKRKYQLYKKCLKQIKV